MTIESTVTEFDPKTWDPWDDASPWDTLSALEKAEEDTGPTEARENSARAGESHAGAPWEDMTKYPMDWQRHMMTLDIPKPAKILGVVMSHYCGPNSYGCSASIETLAENAALSRSAVDRGMKALRDAGLIREAGKGMAGNKVYRLGGVRQN